MSNIIELSAFKCARSENDELEPRAMGRKHRRTARRLRFRSYNLILQSDEADLLDDVCYDMDKAQKKLNTIRRQIAADREHAAAREKLLTSGESRLSAAIVAARSHTPGPRLEQPLRSKLPRERPAETVAAAEAAANVTQLPRRPASSMLEKEFAERIAMLDESGRQYITGYIQPLFDQKGKQ